MKSNLKTFLSTVFSSITKSNRNKMMAIAIISILILSSTLVIFNPLPKANAATIALDTVGTAVVANGISNPSSATLTMTIGTQSNHISIVGISLYASSNPSNDPVTSVKIGSNSYTEAVKLHADSNYGWSEIWYLSNPPTGSQTITINFLSSLGTVYYVIDAYSLYNVNTSSPIGQTATNSGTSATTSVSITPATSGSWILDNAYLDATNAALSSPSNTKAWNVNSNSGSGALDGASQYNPTPAIGSANTFSWTNNISDGWISVAAEVKAAGTSGNTFFPGNISIGGNIYSTNSTGPFKIVPQPGVGICMGTGC